MTANYSYPTNISGSSGLLQYVNMVTDGWFGTITLIMIFAITFIALKDYKTNRAFAVASWVVGIIGVFFRSISIISDPVLYICIVAAGLGLVALLVEEDEG